MRKLTPERWAKAREVLFGGSSKGTSLKCAASAAGVPASYLRAWVERSEKKLPEDPDWIHRIAGDVAVRDAELGATYEDLLHRHATVGVPTPIIKNGKEVGITHKLSEKALMALLGAHDEKFAKKSGSDVNVNINMGSSERYRRLLAAFRLNEAQKIIDAQDELAALGHKNVA